MGEEGGDEGSDGLVSGDGGAEVEAGGEGVEGCGGGAGEIVGSGVDGCGELEVAAEGFEDVLPRAGGVGVADGDGLASEDGADGVGDDAVGGPVAAADDIAGAGAGDADGGVRGVEERAAVGGDGDFRGPFASAVGVVTAHGVGFAVGVEPLAVFVALVGGDHDDGAGTGGETEGVEHVDGAHDIDGEGFDGLVVGEADERLGGEVEDEVWGGVAGDGGEAVAVHDIGAVVCGDTVVEVELVEEEGVGERVEGVAVDFSAESEEPFGEPCAFETGVACEEDAAVAEEVVEEGWHGCGREVREVYQTFHGASPSAQRRLRCWAS